MDMLAMAVGVASLLLGGFSIWLSLQFYAKGKDAELAASKSLEGIRCQTDMLQRLTARQMDRLTEYVTQPRPADEGLLTLVATIADLPGAILGQLPLQTASATTHNAQSSDGSVFSELISCYIALYWYTGVVNLALQTLLPNRKAFDKTSEDHQLVKRLLDGSADDFAHMRRVIDRVVPERLNASPYRPMLEEAFNVLQPRVKTTEQTQQHREREVQPA